MDEPTVFGRRHHSTRTTTDKIGAAPTLLTPLMTERKLLILLLPLFALAASSGWAISELLDQARWFERYCLVPASFGFLLLMLAAILSPAHHIWRIRSVTLVIGPGIVMIRFVQLLIDLHNEGFDENTYFNLSPWLILCAALYIFLLPVRLSWRLALGYWGSTLVMLAIFLALQSKPLPVLVETELLLNYVIAPPVFIALLSAFTRLRADYVRANTHADDLRELALLDGLTGLQNRRAFRQSFKRAKARQLRNKTPLCVMLLDIDHFKRVNDTYGHQVGDEVLIKLASVLTRELRGTDEVFRWGGEEFLLLLEETPSEHLEQLAERLRAAVEHEQFLDKSTVTISIGATHILPHEEEDVVYPRADEALYVSKRDGRNRVTIVEAPKAKPATPDFQP